jgi:hypothetical protein
MIFPLSFSFDFFINDTDYSLTLNKAKNIIYPTSVFQALMAMPLNDWENLSNSIFNISGDELDIDMVISQIKNTNMCEYLTDSIQVWIDDTGNFKLNIYQKE